MRIRHLMLAATLAVPTFAVAQDTTMQEPLPGEEVRTGMPMGAEQVEIFKDKDNWEIHGTVTSVDPQNNQVTLQREENLPPVQLQVAQGTEIKMDGEDAQLSQLQAGNEVRAKFNLANDQPLAISLDAKPSKAQKEMQKDQERMQREQEQMNR